MAVEAYLPSFGIVTITAVIDAINPCAIGVMILMVSTILGSGGSMRRLIYLGIVYTSAVFLTYLIAGLGFLYFFSTIPLAVVEYLSIGVALAILVAAIIEIKDYFWYGQWLSLAIPVKLSKKIHKQIDELNEMFSGNIKINSIYDQSVFIKKSITGVVGSAVLGGVLSFFVDSINYSEQQFQEFLTNTEYNDLKLGAAFNDDSALRAVNAGSKVSWQVMDKGICPVGCQGCDNG